MSVANDCNFTCSFVRIVDQTNATITAVRKRLVNRPGKEHHMEPTTAESRKRSGDHIDVPSGKRQKNTHSSELVGCDSQVIVVRLYRSRLDWDHIREVRVVCNNKGLDLEEVRAQLGVQGKCRVSQVIVICKVEYLTYDLVD